MDNYSVILNKVKDLGRTDNYRLRFLSATDRNDNSIMQYSGKITMSAIITSRSNAVFKKLLGLQTAKGIGRNGCFLAGGDKLIRELCHENREMAVCWIRSPDLALMPPALSGVKQITLSKELFRELNLLGTPGPLLEVRLPRIVRFNALAPWPDGCSLFIPFGDPENVGAVIRSAAGLGVGRVVLLSEAACPFLPRAIRSSAGAVLRIRIEDGPSIADLAAIALPHPLYALDMGGRPLTGIDWPATFGLIAGMEGEGLTETVKKRWRTAAIPLENGVESLNAAASVSIALWDWKSKKR